MNYNELSVSLVGTLARSHEASLGHAPPAPAPGLTVTISREPGALGSALGAELGRRLGWPVYDREVLDQLAEAMKRPVSHLEGLDERSASWLEDCLGHLINEYHIGTDSYVKYLLGTLRALGAGGKCIIVGRGANFVLPRETTLRLRLIATPEDRARTIAQRRNLPIPEAKAWAEKTEQHRSNFVRRIFQRDVADPHHYDLVLNMSRMSVEEAAEEVLRLLERRTPAPKKEKAAAQ